MIRAGQRRGAAGSLNDLGHASSLSDACLIVPPVLRNRFDELAGQRNWNGVEHILLELEALAWDVSLCNRAG
jgi:hypothetical protein